MIEQRSDQVHRHLEHFWPTAAKEHFVWTVGPIGWTVPTFSVMRLAPSSERPYWTYVSEGASDVLTAEGYGIEFVVMSPSSDPIHVESLAMVANFHADPKYTLSVGRVVDIGRPWMDESSCDHFLVSLPYVFGPGFEWCDTIGGRIRFLWLLPITTREAEFAKTHGIDLLESKFDSAGFNVVDVRRASVI